MERTVSAIRNVTSGTSISNWVNSNEDSPKSGWPSMSMDDNHIAKVLAVFHQNHRLTVREVGKEAGICKSYVT